MKLSTELALTNLVLLVVLFYCATQKMLTLWGVIACLMGIVWLATKRAQRIERAAAGLERARKMIERKFKP